MADDIPKYEQIAYDVRRKIIKGIYKKNTQLPLERDMESQYGVSRITIKKAIDSLVNEGYVLKRRGAGTFVTDFDNGYLTQQTPNYQGFSEKFADHDVSSGVLVFKVEQAGENISAKLNLNPQDFVYHIERIRYVDDVPMTYQITYIPINLLIGLRFDNVVDSLYLYVQDVARLKIQSAHRSVSAKMPTAEEQTFLKIKANEPVLEIESRVFLDTGQLFEYTRSRYRSDRYQYRATELR